MKIKTVIFFIIISFFSCESKETLIKKIDLDENGNYIVYRWNLHRQYWNYYGKYIDYYLKTDYGLRMEGDKNWELKNIFLYDGKNEIEYIIKNIDDLENILLNNFPSEIDINYYFFFMVYLLRMNKRY